METSKFKVFAQEKYDELYAQLKDGTIKVGNDQTAEDATGVPTEVVKGIDQKAFELAIDTILSAKRIYVVGIRSCAPLASFLCFYLNLVCENVTAVNTNSSSEIFEQLIRINEEDVTNC